MADLHILLHRLQYQYPTGVTTMGHCTCGNLSRGSGTCADCLSEMMVSAGAKPEHVRLLRAALANRREAQHQVQDCIDTIMEAQS